MTKYQAVMEEVVVWIRRNYHPDCCIDAARLLVQCSKAMKFRAEPVSVCARVLNPEMSKHGRMPESDGEAVEWRDEGCWAVILGALHVPASGPDMWPGHLVVRANGNALLDPSVTQANRPGTGVDVHPVMFVCDDASFWNGESAAVVECNGCTIIYTVHKEDKSWQNATGWHRKVPGEIQELTRRARESLRCGKSTTSSSTSSRRR
jgi:hypothetical protein